MPSILILGLNPSASLTLSFSSSSPLTLGAVNRASSAHNSAGGKGQNTALALHTWLHRSDNAAACHSIDKDKSNDLSSKNEWNLRIVQTLGSTTGSQVSQRLLNACHLISQRTIELPFATRTTVTLIDSQSGQVTELIEPNSGTISAEHAEQIRREIETGVEGADALIMMGTVPPGLDSVAIYADAARVYKEKSEGKGLVFMDTSKGVVETVDKAKGAIDCVKINLDEAIDILSKMGENVEGDGEERGKKVAKRLAKRLDGVKLLGITDGPRWFVFYDQPNRTCENSFFLTIQSFLSFSSINLLAHISCTAPRQPTHPTPNRACRPTVSPPSPNL